ncbi:MAG: usg protein [Rhodospirillales bacterium]
MEEQIDRGLDLQLKGYRLATAEILYYMPDHPAVLQSFVWQHYDLAPNYPRLGRFIDYWRREIEAVLHSVTVGRRELIAAPELKPVNQVFTLQ